MTLEETIELARDASSEERREVVVEWAENEFRDVDDVLELWEERAAIREYEANTPRWAAEVLAFVDVRVWFGRPA